MRKQGGQFHHHAYTQLLRAQIPKAQKDSQVIRRKKVNPLVEMLYFSGFELYTVLINMMKLTRGVNFTKLCAPIKKLPVQSIVKKQAKICASFVCMY